MDLKTLLVAAVLIINTFASVVVLRVPVFSATQRLLQLAFIWLVPIIGAVFCSVFAYSQALGPTSAGTMDPLYFPSDGGVPGDHDNGICSSNGGDIGAAGGEGGD